MADIVTNEKNKMVLLIKLFIYNRIYLNEYQY